MKILARLLAVLAVWGGLFAAPAVAQVVPGSPVHVAVLNPPAPFAPTAALAIDFTRGKFRQVRTRTNLIQNPTASGAVAGTPGTSPTRWTLQSSANGLSRQIVGTGTTADGRAYIDVRWFGTASATGVTSPLFEPTNAIAAATGSVWTLGADVAIVGGSTSTLTGLTLRIAQYGAGSTYLQESAGSVVSILGASSTLTRYTYTGTASNAAVVNVVPYFQFTYNSGAVVDFTIRIAAPQFEAAPAPSPFVVGSVTENVVAGMNGSAADLGGLYGWSFSRTGSGLADSTAGTYATFATGAPRITDRGLLVEEQRTNLLPYSDPNNATGYSDTSATSAPGGSYGPFTGRIVTGQGATWHRRGVTGAGSLASVTSGTTYSFLVLFKPGTSGRIRLEFRNTAGTAGSALRGPVANPTTVESSAYGTITTTGVTQLPSGLYAWSGTWVPNATGNIGAGSGVGPDSAIVGETVEFVHFQLEQGAFPTSPIVTTGASATRAADTAYVSGLGFVFSAPFTVFVDADMRAIDGLSRKLFVLGDGTTNNRAQVYRNATNGLQIAWRISGVDTFSAVVPGFSGAKRVKAALTWDGSALWLTANGVDSGPAAVSLPALNRLSLGDWSEQSSGPWNDPIRSVVVYPRALSAAERIAITSGSGPIAANDNHAAPLLWAAA
jgi:hypothetical protein